MNQILDFPDYAVDEEGQIFSFKKARPMQLKPIIKKTGYRYVFLYQERRQVKRYVHDLVLRAFIGQPKANQECRHRDGDPGNNRLDNLLWGTRVENTADKRRHGTLPEGERAGTHKLTNQEVRRIREEYPGRSLRELAHLHGVSHTTIRKAALGIRWRNVKQEKDR